MFVDGLPDGALAGIGLCSQVNTHVFVDAAGEALAPAIVWQDGRCAEDAARLDALVPDAAGSSGGARRCRSMRAMR